MTPWLRFAHWQPDACVRGCRVDAGCHWNLWPRRPQSRAGHSRTRRAPGTCVNLTKIRNESEASDAGHPWNRFYQLVCTHINDVQDSRPKMRRQQVVILIVDRQIIEALSLGAG